MAKQKTATLQEQYRARKQQEEQERLSLLPPGLINHGNTCFMNSVLQGLLATRLLGQLVHFEPIPPRIQEHSNTLLASQRSPQLTNGHQLGGIYEQSWVDSMPIGDVFITVMYRAWEAQRLRRRDIQSPKPLLTALGRKYDQYFDFAQQDAHEFLRILLDAMRMEEFDVIKKRQPPPEKKPKRPRRRTTITPNNIHSISDETDPAPPDESTRLMSLSDMLFGGQLTSILVCQKCKHVSQTYEDFNDLSLSIKPEDYAKEKRRDRLKKLARKMGMVGGRAGKGKRAVSAASAAPSDLTITPPLPATDPRPLPPHPPVEISVDPPISGIRASSVPPSPNPGGIADEPPFSPDSSRRRSLDGLTSGGSSGGRNTVTDDDEDDAAVTPKIERSKSKDKDGWARISRRISMSVGIGKKEKEKGEDKGKDKSKGKERSSRSTSRKSIDLHKPIPVVNVNSDSPAIRLSRPSISPERPQSSPPLFLKRASQDLITRAKSKSRPQSISPTPSHEAVPTLPGTATVLPAPAPSLHPLAKISSTTAPYPRAKSPRPPKPSKAEEEYLRAILADVQTSSHGIGGNNPFDFLTSWHHHPSANGNGEEGAGPSMASFVGGGSTGSSSAIPFVGSSASLPSTSTPTSASSPGSAWLAKWGQFPLAGVEECLKMFTAVEVLDGENMERKIREENGNGGDESEDEEDSDSDSEDDGSEDGDEGESEGDTSSVTRSGEESDGGSGSGSGLYAHENRSGAFSVFSSPPAVAGSSNDTDRPSLRKGSSDLDVTDQMGQSPWDVVVKSIPSIYTTSAEDGRDSPSLLGASPTDADRTAKHSPVINGEVLLSVPTLASSKSPTADSETDVSSPMDYGSDGGESDSISISTDVSSSTDPSTAEAKPEAADEKPHQSQQPSPLSPVRAPELAVTTPPPPRVKSLLRSPPEIQTQTGSSSNDKSKRGRSKSKPKQKQKPVIMRPAYKRYLIATPPPILVIHLKRFQQINKNPIMSFSTGFKKLEDYVAFPEYFDLTPFLAPRKEDFGLGGKAGAGGGDKF
ncbi:hypothetical protein D9757_006057 [Collybiopsis confluens]|uniref:ubiquitinyl hydrolase 1 n=1 Tax=Collybiopsis confluens TaxID=2823264 RepID=A0A8H5HUR4_9AGAR|nr:hypothetical protein D9757_006057 [Collybiopsis confluens]